MTFFYGLLNVSWWTAVLIVLVMTHITIASVTIFLHRAQAHRALDMHPIASHFFRFWLWLTTGMGTKAWVAIHRKHHAKCETAEDPHSPQTYGIQKVLLEGAELYRKEAADEETLTRYGMGTPDDWIERHLYSKHTGLGVRLMLVLNLLLFGIYGVTMWAVQMFWIPFFAAGVINGIGHYWGYRNHECKDASRNIVPLGLLIGGEELHNNHHAYPNSAKLSSKPWEFDIGWFYIKLLEGLRLAQVKKVAPKLQVVSERAEVDSETLRVLLMNRFNIMARYGRRVMLPVLRKEKMNAGEDIAKRMYRRAKSLLISEDSLIAGQNKHRLREILANSQRLDLVYQYRVKLQAIWEQTTATQKEMLEALQEWCHQAEAAGVDALSDFVRHLRHLRVASSS